jgi:hypothetical protein
VRGNRTSAPVWQSHIMWIAGAATLTAGIVGVAVHSAAYWRLERDQAPTPSPVEPRR